MYQDLFTNSFLLNFLISFLFLTVCFLCSLSVSLTLNKNKINLLGEFQVIIIFFLLFIFFLILLNLLVLFNFYNYFNLIFYSIFCFQIFYVLRYVKYFKKEISKIFINDKIIILFLFIFI